MTIRVGVIGVGNIGTAHARNLAGSVAGSTVSAVFDVSQERSADVAAELGCRATSSLDELVGGDDVDAIVIASPDGLHAEQALACLAVGKPALCEKPLAPTSAAAKAVLDAEVAIGRRLVTVGFMRRFDPGYIGLKNEIQTGAIGPPLLVHNVHRVAFAPYGLTSAGTVTNAAIHEIDINRWLLDDEYERSRSSLAGPAPTCRTASAIRCSSSFRRRPASSSRSRPSLPPATATRWPVRWWRLMGWLRWATAGSSPGPRRGFGAKPFPNCGWAGSTRPIGSRCRPGSTHCGASLGRLAPTCGTGLQLRRQLKRRSHH